MHADFMYLLLLGILAASANIFGGLILFPAGIYSRFKNSLKYLLALGAGFMLAVTIVEIFPKIIGLWHQPGKMADSALFIPMALILAGYLLTQFFEHTIAPHFHLGEEVHSDHLISVSSAYTAIGGLFVHTFFDGVSIAAAAALDFKAGILVFLAIFLHKFPEGFTIASMVLAAGKGFKEVLTAITCIGLATISGILFFLFIGSNIGFTVAYALPMAAGVTLYVSASDLIPEVNHHGGKKPLVSLCVFGGVALFFSLHYLLHIAIEN